MRFSGLSINGKFLAAQPTGVHRVAAELIRQIDKHGEELAELFGSTPVIHAPNNFRPDSIATRLPVRSTSVLTGQLWEQLELPWRTRGSLLLSFCNLSPVAAGHAVTMLHDAQTFSTPASYGLGFRSFYRLVQPMIGARALRILTVSNYSAGELVRYGIAPAERINVIHNGVDHGKAHAPDAAVITRLGLTPERYVLALSSTQSHKNLRVLLAAFAGDMPPDVKLVLFGSEGPARFAEAGLAVPDNVLFAGRVSDGELAALMGSALCFAMPSTTEGFGLPPLEAMVLGCPAVVAPCGALPEVCGDAALYAAPDDAGQWRTAITRLASDPDLRARLSIAGRAHAMGMNWDRAGDQLLVVLREIAGG